MLENLNGTIRRVTRNVKHWKDGKMIQRWVAAGILEAEEKFRKLRGFQDLTKLSSYLSSYADQTVSIDSSEPAAQTSKPMTAALMINTERDIPCLG